jgi:integrase
MAIFIRCSSCKSDISIGLKKCPNCKTTIPKNRKYRVVVRDGKDRITRIVNNLELAREVETALKNDILRGEYKLRKHRVSTVNDVWKKYLPWSKENKAKSWFTDDFYYKKHIEPVFGNRTLDRISQFDLEKHLIAMKNGSNQYEKKYSEATRRHILILLSHIYRKASEWNMYTGANPCTRVKKIKLNNQITEFLSIDEVKRLMDTLDKYPDRMGASIIKFALLTGLRRSEIFKLQWDHINFERSLMKLKDPKSGEDETLPLSPETLKVLKDVPRRQDTPFVFYGAQGQQRKYVGSVWESVKMIAKLPDGFRFHGLRHHFGSALANAGVDLYTIQRLLRHRDPYTTMRYAHLQEKHLRDVVNLSDSLLIKNKGKVRSIKDGK